MCLFSVYQPIHVSFFSVWCLISGVAGQAGSPETVWRIEDLYGELHSWRWPHGCLQRGSRWRSPALLRGRLILEGQLGDQCDLGPEGKRLWTLWAGPIRQDFHSKGNNSSKRKRVFCVVWRNSRYPRLSSGNWMTGWETSLLNCHSVCSGFSCFSVLQE